MSQDRDLVEEERQARLAARADDRTRPSAATGGMDAGTRKLAIVAGGLGGLLVLMVGGWSLLGHHPAGIPILSPPPGPVRVKPIDPGGMQLMGTQVAQTNDGAAQALAPGPEEAAPQALQAEVDKAREADRPAATAAVAATGAPVGAAPGAAPGAAAPPPAAVPATAAPPVPAAPPAAPAAAPAVPPAVQAHAAPAPIPGSVPDASDGAAPAATAGGHHAVQLAALDSEAGARAEWARLSRRAPSLFAGHSPAIAGISRGGKQFFRLRTGGFASVAAATAFCAQAKQAGIACTLADF